MTEMLSAISSMAAAVGVLIAAWQLRAAHQQSITTFEDSLAREYRELAAKLPSKAPLGGELTEQEHERHLDTFYQYFDICNEQAFLLKSGRIRRATWDFWHDGMKSNFRRPAFKRAWSEVCTRATSDFSELRTLFPPVA